MGDIETQFGLEQSDIKAIVDILKRNKKVEKIIFFSSRAKNSSSKGSDIDIALTGKNLHTNDIRRCLCIVRKIVAISS